MNIPADKLWFAIDDSELLYESQSHAYPRTKDDEEFDQQFTQKWNKEMESNHETENER